MASNRFCLCDIRTVRMDQWRTQTRHQRSEQIAEMLCKQRQQLGRCAQNSCLLQELVQPGSHQEKILSQAELHTTEALLVSILNGGMYATPLEKKRLLQCVHDGKVQAGTQLMTMNVTASQKRGENTKEKRGSMELPQQEAQPGNKKKNGGQAEPIHRRGRKKEQSRLVGTAIGTKKALYGRR